MPDMEQSRAASPVVILMLKAPRVGTVKTRLGAQIGHEAATKIYRILVEHQVASTPPDWQTEVHFSPADASDEMQRWLGSKLIYFPQSDGDLGRRLARAVAGAFERGARSVIVVGGDCPALDEGCLRQTSEELGRVDVVVGPAVDGGYYLIALRRPVPGLFEDIPWSTENVLVTSLLRITEAGLQHALLEPKEDVDDLAGLRRIVASDAFANSELGVRLHPCLPRRATASRTS